MACEIEEGGPSDYEYDEVFFHDSWRTRSTADISRDQVQYTYRLQTEIKTNK